jgi:hypothetical protein
MWQWRRAVEQNERQTEPDRHSLASAQQQGSDSGNGRVSGLILLILYTIAAIIVLPFSVVLMLYAPLLVGGLSPLVAPVAVGLLVLPLLILVCTIGAWVAWARRRPARPALIFAAVPVVYGLLEVALLSIFVG